MDFELQTGRRFLGLWCVLVWLAGALPAMPSLADALTGQPAPDLVLHGIDGHDYRLSALRGKVVIVTFWATWCAPCREELPLLSAFAKAHAGDGLRVLAFALDGPDTLSQVRSMARTLDFPVGLLGSSWAGEYGRIWRIPVSFVLDRQGRLVFNSLSSSGSAWDRESLQRRILPLLQSGPAGSAASR